jgi:hypothetical protein
VPRFQTFRPADSENRIVVMQRFNAKPAFLEPAACWHERCSFCKQNREGDSIMLWTILVILLVLWLIGLLSHVGGSLIHLLLVVAVVVLIINLVTGRRAV